MSGSTSLPSGAYPDRKFVCLHPALPATVGVKLRSGRRESNPQQQLGRLRQYHFATPAYRRHFAAPRGSLPAHPPLRCASWRTTNQSGRPDLNRRPLRPKRSALPSAPRPGPAIKVYRFSSSSSRATGRLGVSQFRRAGPSAFPPGRQRPGSGKNEALKHPFPPCNPRSRTSTGGKRALPAPCATSARPFTAWPSGPRRFWDTPQSACLFKIRQKGGERQPCLLFFLFFPNPSGQQEGQGRSPLVQMIPAPRQQSLALDKFRTLWYIKPNISRLARKQDDLSLHSAQSSEASTGEGVP